MIQKFKTYLTKIFSNKYNFIFKTKEYTHKHFFNELNFTEIDSNKFLSIKCIETFQNKKVILIISFESSQYKNRKKEFYESGFWFIYLKKFTFGRNIY